MNDTVKSVFTVILLFRIGIFDGCRGRLNHYTNLWVVQTSRAVSRTTIETIAINEGFELPTEMNEMPGLYYFIHKRHPKRSKFSNTILTKRLFKHTELLWADQVPMGKLTLRSNNCPGHYGKGQSFYNGLFRDPFFNSQWLLHDCRIRSNFPLLDLNVIPVWYNYKIFGKGIIAVISDSDIEFTHDDLKDNYDESLSINLYDDKVENFKPHGTRVAGILAMRAGNNFCGVGFAPLITLGSMVISREKFINYADRLKGFSFHKKTADIISCSWGPTDDGKTLEYMPQYMMTAFKDGIIEGRQGKGIIYIFASGNGRPKFDNCAYDEYVNSIYTIATSGIQYQGAASVTSEFCSGILVASYTADYDQPVPWRMITTDLNNECNSNWVGETSAVAPQVSGIVALILEANPDLTWRGIQHILVWTSEIAAIANNENWKRNKANLFYHPNFGFGMINALAAVKLAITLRNHSTLPPMNCCILQLNIKSPINFNLNNNIQISVLSNGCKKLPSIVNYIEHVQLVITINYWKRGNLEILLTAPSGTETQLLYTRKNDESKEGLKNWTLNTVHLWGENPRGEWNIKIFDRSSPPTSSPNLGEIINIGLVIYGTKLEPVHYSFPRKYYKPVKPYYSIPQKNKDE